MQIVTNHLFVHHLLAIYSVPGARHTKVKHALLGATQGHHMVNAKRAACSGVLGTPTALKSARKFKSKRWRKDRVTDTLCWGRGAGWQGSSLLSRRLTLYRGSTNRGQGVINTMRNYSVFWKFRRGRNNELNVILWMLREMGYNLVLPDLTIYF